MLILLEETAEDKLEGVRRVIDTAILDVVEYSSKQIESYRHDDTAPRIAGLNTRDTSHVNGYSMFEAVQLQLTRVKLAGVASNVKVNDDNKNTLVDWVGTGSTITKFDIPYGVNIVDELIFDEITSLQSVRIPPTVEIIGECTFRCCSSLKEVEFTGCSTLREVQMGAFARCSSLREISLPETVRVLESDVFTGCTSLESISFGGFDAELKRIGTCCFQGCEKLAEIDLPGGIDFIGSFALDGTKIKELDLRVHRGLVSSLLNKWFKDIKSSGMQFDDDCYKSVVTAYPRSDANIDIIVLRNDISSHDLDQLTKLANVRIIEKGYYDD